MQMIEAMRQCKSGQCIARRAYPNRKYYKHNGIFPTAVPPAINRIDFMADDWEISNDNG